MWYIDIIRGTWSAVNGGSTLAPLHQHCPMLKCSRTIKLISVAPFMESFFFLVAVAAGDFMVLSTLPTFICRVAKGCRRCHSHPCCLMHGVLVCLIVKM